MEDKMMPANLHYESPNPDIPGLVDGRLQVVTDRTPVHGGLMAVNSFGFGGSNVHTVLKPNVDSETECSDSSKRLFLYSSRTEDGVNKVLSSVEEQSKNINLHALLNESRNIDNLYRGYTVLNTENNVKEVQVNNDFTAIFSTFH